MELNTVIPPQQPWFPVSCSSETADAQPDDTLTIFNALSNTSSATAMYVLRKYLEKQGLVEAPSLSAILPNPCSALAYDIDKVFGRSIQVLWRPDTRKVSLIWLHTIFGIHHVLNCPYRYITFLRDPRMTFVSRAFFLAQARDIQSLEHFTDRCEEQNLLCHDLARFHTHFGEQTITLFPNLLEPKPTAEQALVKARANILRYYSFVGIAELFNESLFLLSRHLGYHEITLWERQCATRGRPELADIPHALLKKIEKRVEADMELYEFCKKRLLEQLSTVDFGRSLVHYNEAMKIQDAPAHRRYFYG
jgi:hypothetical protein